MQKLAFNFRGMHLGFSTLHIFFVTEKSAKASNKRHQQIIKPSDVVNAK